MSRRTAGALLLLVGLAAGCGTTVSGSELAQRAVVPGGDGLGVAAPGSVPGAGAGSVPGGAAPTLGDSAGGELPAAAGTAAGPSARLPGGAAPGVTAPGATGPGAAAASGRGFTKDKVFLGIEYVTGFDAVASAAGLSLSSGDARALSQAVVDDINARGGVRGRRLVPVFHETPQAATEQDAAAADQATCSDFSQDNQVVAAVSLGSTFECLAAARVPALRTGSMIPVDDVELRRLQPYLYYPAVMSWDRLAPVLLDRLQAQGYFGPESRVGLLSGDRPADGRTVTLLKAALKARGIEVVSEYAYNSSDLSTITSGMQAAVLRFSSDRVDRVIPLDGNVFFFMQSAENQAYRPRYALSSYLNLASVQEPNAPPEQLVGSVGVGWSPSADVSEGRDPGANAARKRCQELVRTSGQDFNGKRLAQWIANAYCDAIRLVVAGIAEGGFAPQELRAGIAAVGPQFPSALNFRSGYSASRVDGAGGVRDIGYDQGCRCFSYRASTVHGS